MKRYIKTAKYRYGSGTEYYSADEKSQHYADLSEYDRRALKTIFDNVYNKGYRYGKWMKTRNPELLGEYIFEVVLYRDGNYFVWRNYGSSANPATLEDLLWTINMIFNMEPSDFIEKYVCVDDYENEVE